MIWIIAFSIINLWYIFVVDKIYEPILLREVIQLHGGKSLGFDVLVRRLLIYDFVPLTAFAVACSPLMAIIVGLIVLLSRSIATYYRNRFNKVSVFDTLPFLLVSASFLLYVLFVRLDVWK